MKRISLFIFLSSLLAFSGCREDIDDTEVIPSALDFNLVTIDNVSEPGEDGFRTITLTLSDKTGSSLKMTAGSCYKHLEAGWYSIVTNADERLEAQTDDDSVGFYRKCGFAVERIVVDYPDGSVVRYNCVLNK